MQNANWLKRRSKVGKSWKDSRFPDKFRIPVPKPGRPMPSERDYNRKRDKKVIVKEEEND